MAAILNSAILNLAILDSAILVFPLKLTHTCQDWFPPFAQKNSLIHSDSTWWWQPSWILPCWIQTLPSWIQTPCYLLSDSLTLHSTLTQHLHSDSDSNSFNLTQLDDHILNSAILDSDTVLDSDTLLSSLRFTQKHSHSTLTQTQTNLIWNKLIHSHSTWWWQPSWILPCWIQTLGHLGFSHLSYFLSNSKTLAKIGSHSFAQKNFTHSFWLNLMMAAN